MILPWLIGILVLGGILAWLADWHSSRWSRWVAMAALAIELILLVIFWGQHAGELTLAGGGPWLAKFDRPWIPQLGVSFYLALDGLSLLLVVLSTVLGILAVAASWDSVTERVGFFHFNLLVLLAAIVGVFLALDLFLFYIFWEIMLVPLALLIAIWGHENRIYAAVKFFLFTQAGGLFMLLAILGLYFLHYAETAVYTFRYHDLLGISQGESSAWWLMLGFFIAFAVKLPMVPFHTWLPDAHTEAPTAGSVALAGLVLKVGAYGFLRFVVPLFPGPASALAPAAMALGVVGILYGAIVAFGQTHLKRLVAYTSVSHMGFILLGVFAWNQIALQGVVIVMLAHGISTSALFILCGDLHDRLHTFEMSQMGGFWRRMPRMGGVGLLFALASLGLPGLGNFVGEFLVLLGAYRANVPLAILATLGFIVSAIYSLWIVQRVFHGGLSEEFSARDMTLRETGIMGVMVVLIVALGLYPQPVLSTGRKALQNMRGQAAGLARKDNDRRTPELPPASSRSDLVKATPQNGPNR